VKNYTSVELVRLSKSEKDARMRIRILAVSCFLECHNRAQVARQLKVSRRSVNEWVKKYLDSGIDGLKANMRSTNASKLSEQQKRTLYQYIDDLSRSELGGRLTGVDIQSYIEQQFGIHYHLNHVYKILKSIGLSWITSRSKHPKQSLEAQAEFKKTHF
jgi:transposase